LLRNGSGSWLRKWRPIERSHGSDTLAPMSGRGKLKISYRPISTPKDWSGRYRSEVWAMQSSCVYFIVLHPGTGKPSKVEFQWNQNDDPIITVSSAPWFFAIAKRWLNAAWSNFGVSEAYQQVCGLQDYINSLWVGGKWPIVRTCSDKTFDRYLKEAVRHNAEIAYSALP
jgi:hypothetical protein